MSVHQLEVGDLSILSRLIASNIICLYIYIYAISCSLLRWIDLKALIYIYCVCICNFYLLEQSMYKKYTFDNGLNRHVWCLDMLDWIYDFHDFQKTYTYTFKSVGKVRFLKMFFRGTTPIFNSSLHYIIRYMLDNRFRAHFNIGVLLSGVLFPLSAG